MYKSKLSPRTPSRRGSRKDAVTRWAHMAMAATAMTLLAACSSETYDTGDGRNSYLTAEMGLIRSSADLTVRSATLDDGSTLTFSNPFTLDWVERPDTVYRALVYYDRTQDDVSKTAMKARSVARVPVMGVRKKEEVGTMLTDPLGIESVWTSSNGSYVNISLLLKAGKTDADDAIQTVGIVNEGMRTDDDGRRTLRLTLYHDQGSVPEYYTVQRYVSIDTRLLQGADRVTITANTYKGMAQYDVEGPFPTE